MNLLPGKFFHIHSKQCPHLVSTRFLAGAQSKALPNDHPKRTKSTVWKIKNFLTTDFLENQFWQVSKIAILTV